MSQIRETVALARWFASLRDDATRAWILVRIRRLSLGNPGDARPVGGGVSELRFDWCPGYRVYFVSRGSEVTILLGGGSKSTQSRDIRRAIEMARRVKGS